MLAPEFYAAALDDSPYFRFYERSPVTRLLRAAIPRYMRAAASVLDIGCGNAIAACHLAACGGERLTYVGVDPDPAACEWARRVIASLPPERIRGRIVAQTLDGYLEAADPPFDVIWSSWSFRACLAIDRPERHEATTRAIADLLAPDGVLLVGDAFVAPGADEAEIDRIRRHHRRLAGQWGAGRAPFPPDLIDDLFRRAGLERVERQEVPAVPLTGLLGMPHDRYCLQVFARRTPPGRGR